MTRQQKRLVALVWYLGLAAFTFGVGWGAYLVLLPLGACCQ